MRVQSKKDKLYDFDIPISSNRNDKEQIKWHGKTNQTTLDFVNNRYVVLRDFIPIEIIRMTMDAWRCIENDERQFHAHFVKEDELTHSTPEEQRNKSHGAYNFPPAVGLHTYLKNKLNSVLDLNLRETYSYTRKYVRGASLTAHTDRPSCEVSLTFPLDYKTDDNTPWKIWLNNEGNWVNCVMEKGQRFIKENTQDIHRGKSIELELGDVLLYQGPNIPHWRNTLMGDYSYHMFIHFFNERSKMNQLRGFQYKEDRNFPLKDVDLKSGNPNVPKFILDWDGNMNKWDMTKKQGRGNLLRWVEDVYNTLPDKHLYVNNYSYLTGKVEEDLIVCKEDLE